MPRGGFRKNAGRKGFYGEKTIAVKIPASRVEEVKAFLKGESVDSVTKTDNKNDSVTKTKITKDDLAMMYELWQGSLARSAQAEKRLQLTSSDMARTKKDFSKTGDCIQKLFDIEKIITDWSTKCTPERVKAARWQKACDLLMELEEAINSIA